MDIVNPFFFLYLFIPALVVVFAKFVLKLQICRTEMLIQMGVGVLAVAMMWGVTAISTAMYKPYDTEVLNGQITGKDVNRMVCIKDTYTGCTNSYSCDCYTVCTPTTDSKGNVTGQSCTTHCSTCYRYPWEQDWYAIADINPNISISRVDAQGAKTPPRWTAVKIGEPASTTSRFVNWLKPNTGTLFKDGGIFAERYKEIIPAYPKINDLYRVNRVLGVQTTVPNHKAWNDGFNTSLKTLGPKKELNIVMVVAKDVPREFSDGVQYAWHGLKQNDAVLFYGLDKNGNVSWVRVMSWAASAIFDVEVTRVMEASLGKPFASVDPVSTVSSVERIALAKFERKPMEEFEYLKKNIKPPIGWMIFAGLLVLGLSIAAAAYFHHNDDFTTDSRFRNRNRYW